METLKKLGIFPNSNRKLTNINTLEVRSQKSEVRSQKSEVRSQKSEVRSRESGVGSRVQWTKNNKQ